MIVFSPRRLALQAVTISSATLSALYYATQAPSTTYTLWGYEAAPFVILVAATAFALDAAKPLMMQVAGTSGIGFAKRAVALLTFAVLLITNMLAIDGILLTWRSDWQANRGDKIQTYTDIKKARDAAEADLKIIGPARTVAEIDALIAADPIPMGIYRRSEGCTKITVQATKDACQSVLTLQNERGRAVKRANLEAALATSRGKLEYMETPIMADPQTKVWSDLSGLNEATVAYLMVAILGIAIELVASFSQWTLMQPPPKVRAPTPIPAVPLEVVKTGDNVVSWCQAFEKQHGRRPRLPEVQRVFPELPKTTAWRRIQAA